MERSAPSCGECGDLEVVLAGVHPGDTGVVRWTLFGCGHVTTEVAGDDPSDDAMDGTDVHVRTVSEGARLG